MQTLVLSADDVRRTVNAVGLNAIMDAVTDGLHRACSDYREGRYSTPRRAGFSYSEPVTGLLEWMPAMDGDGRATIKIVGYHPRNPTARGLPTIISVVAQCETETGRLTAFLDGTFLTAVRTGAATALASCALARRESRVLGMIGCGAQAVTQLHALSRHFELETLLIWDADAATLASFADRADRLGLKGLRIEPLAADEIVRRCDILCTVTSVAPGGGPVFEATDVQPWLHINAVGSDFPGKTEIPLGVLERSYICTDFTEQCLVEGECQRIAADRVDTTLAELPDASDLVTRREQLTLFDSTGWALQDHVAANILVTYARKLDLGTPTEIEIRTPGDPKDPYGFLDDESAAPVDYPRPAARWTSLEAR